MASRTKEIGIRMALGATRGRVQAGVVAESLVLVVAGVAIGAPIAIAGARLASSRLYGVTPFDPATLTPAIVLLAAVGALAALVPARRATRIDPLAALRCE